MLIESLIRRQLGTIVEFAGKIYDFQPDEFGRHVCNVEDETLIELLLDIPEGYVLANPEDGADPEPEPEPDPVSEPVSDTDPEPKSELKASADMSREDLMALYEQKFGEKPHPSIKVETLVKRINEPAE